MIPSGMIPPRRYDTEVGTMSQRLRPFLPRIQPLEERINLSFSLSSMVHTLFPFVPDHSNKPKHPPAVVRTPPTATVTPAQSSAPPRLAAIRAAQVRAMGQPSAQTSAPPRLAANRAGHVKAMGQPSGPMVKPLVHPRGVFNWYSARQSSAAVRPR